jgi:branched-chain amino acid aminotransferase
VLKQESRPQAAPVETTELWAFFRGEFVPLRDANINVMTHGFNYGTAVFEGIRAYWNADEEQLFALELVAHYARIRASAGLLMMEVRQSPEELAEITVELLRRDGLREDAYVRPIVYKSSETIGVRLHNLDSDVTIFAVPFGQYIDTEGGIRAQVSSWRRTDDNAIPARGKITGAYVNGALAKSEAQLNGFDEAIVLTADGHVSEGSAENLFIVKNGVLITPPVTDNILEGITRRRLIGIVAPGRAPGVRYR